MDEKLEALPMGTELLEGEIVIARILGFSEFGFTYKCVHRKFATPVVIKELFPIKAVRNGKGVLQTHGKKTAFRKEKQELIRNTQLTVSSKSHDKIIQIHKIFEENNTVYVVTENLQGQTLLDQIHSQGKLSLDEVQKIAFAMCDVLEHVQQDKSLHGNISAAEILLVLDGRIVLNDCESVLKLAREGLNTRKPDSDIFRLGSALYHALTGSRITKSSNRQTIFADTDIFQPIQDAIRSAVELDEEDRPRTIAEFRAIWLGKQLAPVKKTKEQKRIAALEKELLEAQQHLGSEHKARLQIQEQLKEDRKVKKTKEQERIAALEKELLETQQHLGSEHKARLLIQEQLEKERIGNEEAEGEPGIAQRGQERTERQLESQSKTGAVALRQSRHDRFRLALLASGVLTVFLVFSLFQFGFLPMATVRNAGFLSVNSISAKTPAGIPASRTESERPTTPKATVSMAISVTEAAPTSTSLPTWTPTPFPTAPPQSQSVVPTAVPVARPGSAPVAIRTARVRSGPGAHYSVLSTISRDAQVYIVVRTKEWLYLVPQFGWVWAGDIANVPSGVPTLTPTLAAPKPTPTATLTRAPTPTRVPLQAHTNAGANLRSGPGVGYDVVGVLVENTTVQPVSLSRDRMWLKLGAGAWIYAALVDDIPRGLLLETHLPAPPLPTATPVPTSQSVPVRGDWSLPVLKNEVFLMLDGLEIKIQEVIYEDSSRMQSYIERRGGQSCAGCLAVKLMIINRKGNEKEFLVYEDFKLLKGGPDAEPYPQVKCGNPYALRSMENPGSLRGLAKNMGGDERTVCFEGVAELSLDVKLAYSPVFLYEEETTPTPTPVGSLHLSHEPKEREQAFRSGWSVFFNLLGV